MTPDVDAAMRLSSRWDELFLIDLTIYAVLPIAYNSGTATNIGVVHAMQEGGNQLQL